MRFSLNRSALSSCIVRWLPANAAHRGYRYNPAERPTAEEALQADYFAEAPAVATDRELAWFLASLPPSERPARDVPSPDPWPGATRGEDPFSGW